MTFWVSSARLRHAGGLGGARRALPASVAAAFSEKVIVAHSAFSKILNSRNQHGAATQFVTFVSNFDAANAVRRIALDNHAVGMAWSWTGARIPLARHLDSHDCEIARSGNHLSAMAGRVTQSNNFRHNISPPLKKLIRSVRPLAVSRNAL